MNSPDNNRQMAALITRLLGHYWTVDDHEAVRKAQVADWLQDMQAFSVEVFAESCSRWRIRETRRPTIADMHKICSEVAEMRQEPQRYLPPSQARFPSRAHRDYLRKKIRVNAPERGPGYFALTDAEKWQYHAYDYAFRKLALHDASSPIDPDRQWRDEDMITAATAIFDRGTRSNPDIRAQQERYVKAQAWRNAGKPHPGAFAFTVENIREARRQLDCDDEWPMDLRWSSG